MSPFGAIYTLLESWSTESTRAYLAAKDGADRQLRQSQILGTEQQMLKTMSTIFARVVPSIVREMQIHVPRSTVEKHLYEVLASMHFPTPIPAIKVIHRSCFELAKGQTLHDCEHPCFHWLGGRLHAQTWSANQQASSSAVQRHMTDTAMPIGFCPSLTLS